MLNLSLVSFWIHFGILLFIVVPVTSSAVSVHAPISSSVTYRRPIPPFIQPHRHRPLTRSSATKTDSSINGISKYIWYSSRPFPPELHHQVIGNLSIPLPLTGNSEETGTKQVIFYFLKDVTASQLLQYKDSIARNSPVTMDWDHRERVSIPSFYHRSMRRMRHQSLNFTFSAPNVNMYIIDTGVDISHEEFAQNNPISVNFVEGEDDTDDRGHGTHVASLAVGATYGIARHANLISLKVLNRTDKTDVQTIIKAIQHVITDVQTHRQDTGNVIPSVINLSLGVEPNEGLGTILSLAREQEGLYIVTSAGNRNANACMDGLARSNQTLTVAATDSMDRHARFSNWGPCVDVYAPGVDLLAAVPTKIHPQGATRFSGTSMASPVAAGTLAVYLSKFGYKKGYSLFQQQFLGGIVQEIPPGTPDKFVHLYPDWF